jgi:hypothetical protein
MRWRIAFSVCMAWLGATLATPATALVIGGSSLAWGERVDLFAGLLVNLDSGPLPQAAGSAPGPYAASDDALSIDLGSGTISSGTLVVNAASNVDGAPGARSASADATLESLGIGGALGALLTVSSSSVGSSAEVAGNGALSASGSAVLEDLAISVLGVPLAIPANPAPNTVLFDAAGVLIVLNEQTLSGDGSSGLALVVNALRVEFTNAVLGLGLLNGEIVISHSEAALAAVPEPSLALLALAAAGLLAALGRRAGA